MYTDTRISVNSLSTQQKTQNNDSAVQEIQEIKLKARGKVTLAGILQHDIRKRLWSWGVCFDIQNNKIFAKNIRYPIFLRFYLERMDQNLRDGTKFNRYIFERTHHFSEHGERERCHVTYEFIGD